jgi:hypothetical protein
MTGRQVADAGGTHIDGNASLVTGAVRGVRCLAGFDRLAVETSDLLSRLLNPALVRLGSMSGAMSSNFKGPVHGDGPRQGAETCQRFSTYVLIIVDPGRTHGLGPAHFCISRDLND